MRQAMDDRAQWQLIERIFHGALERDPPDRAEYIRHACADNDDLRKRVESLLDCDKQTSPVDKPLLAPIPEQIVANYRLVSKLGEGGMGTVYLARDMRLDRDVALKILPAEFKNDAERKRRFVREAKAASALNHPHIVTVHDFGTYGTLDYLVMEYVAGKPLDRLIPRNGLKLKEALRYAIQIADALVCAHTAGIIHRDLKPGNVLITESGIAKVVDFGIAKQTRPKPPPGAIARCREDGTLTQHGLIFGTVAYMSPEQAEGKPVDARSDIFSFGSLLYEMVTGRHPFQRDTAASTIAAVLREQPPPASTLAEDVPPNFAALIDRCLRKNPADRFQHTEDLKLALEQLTREPDAGVLTGAGKVQRSRGRFVRPAVMAMAGILVAAAALWYVKTRPPEAALQAVPLTTYPGWETGPTFSPDGTEVAFSWCKDTPKGTDFRPDYANNCNIYIKQIGMEPPFRLTGAPAAESSPAWSPDGRWIAFTRLLSETKLGLLLVPARGGRERVLLEDDVSRSPFFRRGRQFAWTPDSKWLISTSPGEHSPLSLIAVDTGEKRRLTHPSQIGVGDMNPAISPLGRILAFSRAQERSHLWLLRLTEQYLPQGEPQKLPSDNPQNFDPAWLPDGSGLVFASRSNGEVGLWRTSITSGSRPQKLPFTPINAAEPALSQRGNRLAYTEFRDDTNIWSIDLIGPDRRPGAPAPIISSTRADWGPACSPDGKKIAFVSSRSGAPELWACDRDGSNPVQLTSLGVEESAVQSVNGPQWSPDGQSIAFFLIGTHDTLCVMSANGGAFRRLVVPDGGKWPSWSRDGQWLYFASARARGPQPIYKIRPTGGAPVQITPDEGDLPQDSPDGRFVYYEKGWPLHVSIWRIPVEGGQETKLVEHVYAGGQWTVGTNGIYFFTVPDAQGHSEIRLYEFATGRIKKILKVERSIGEKIAVSPDSRTIFYTQIDEQGSDLMLVENFH